MDNTTQVSPRHVVLQEHGIERSKTWPTAEHHWKANHPKCDACGQLGGVQVHHVHPVHTMPPCYCGLSAPHRQGELSDGTGHFCSLKDPKNPAIFWCNYISLCEYEGGAAGKNEDHLKIGHGGNFRSPGNPNVREDAAELLAYPNRRAEIEGRAAKAILAKA